MAKHDMHRGLVALSASAIAAIYTVGLVHTQPADAALNAPSVAEQVASVSPAATQTALLPSIPSLTPTPSTAPGNRAQGGTAPPTPASSGTSTSAGGTIAPSTFKDGTYVGAGTSRFGNVEVGVTVQGGRITNVSLTRVTTKYPASRIASLPGQVVSRQTAQVDTVTGATASAQAFRSAVQQALAKAGSS